MIYVKLNIISPIASYNRSVLNAVPPPCQPVYLSHILMNPCPFFHHSPTICLIFVFMQADSWGYDKTLIWISLKCFKICKTNETPRPQNAGRAPFMYCYFDAINKRYRTRVYTIRAVAIAVSMVTTIPSWGIGLPIFERLAAVCFIAIAEITNGNVNAA